MVRTGDVREFAINKQSIREQCGPAAYMRGEAYFRSGQVASVKKEQGGAGYRAIVKGSSRNRYEVEIAFDEDGEIAASCECAAFSPLTFCKHIAAVLLKLADEETEEQPAENEVISEKDAHLTKQVIFLFDRVLSRQTDSDLGSAEEDMMDALPLEVEYSCKLVKSFSNKPMFAISMKIGLSRLYIVQRIKDFLKHVEAGTSMTFAKHFSYDPSEHVFKEHDSRFIRLMIEAMNVEEIYKDLFHSFSSYSHREERILMIPPAIWEEMLPLLEHLNISFEDKNAGTHRMEMMEGALPISVQLNKAGGEGYQLEIEGLKNSTFMDNYGVAIVNGLLFKSDPAQLKRISDLKKMFHYEKDTRLLIAPEQIESFIDRVVRGLNQFVNVEISPQIADRIVNPPLNARLHLDFEEERLLARLEYVYDDIVISPLPQKAMKNAREDVILMRDLDRENRIMAVIERASFKFNGKDVYLDQEEDVYDFLYDILPQLGDDVEIYATESVKNVMRTVEYQPKARLDVDIGTNWLEVSFDMEGMDEQEIQNLLRNLVEKKKYFRLPSGQFLSLEQESFKEINRLFEELDLRKPDMNGNRIRMPAVRGFQLMDQFGKTSSGIQLGKTLRKLWDNLRNPDNLDFEVPTDMDPILRDYQKYGFQWLKTLAHYRLGGILADDMGLGKTIQSIAYIVSETAKPIEDGVAPSPVLIVSPASLIYNWERECHKFAPELRTVVAAGDRQERSELMSEMKDVDVWITSYPLLRRDIEWYEKQNFRTLFLDEAQAIKNHASLTSHAVRRLQAGQRFALTGTPIENSLDELWSIFEAIFPGLFSGKKSFTDLPREKIARIVRPFILRRLKSEVLKELPDKIESVQPSELSTEQKKLYLAYLEKLQSDIVKDLAVEGGFQRNRMKILAGLTRLRQLCCHPALFLEGYEGTSGKLEQLLEIIEECQGSSKRMLIFSQFTSMLDIIRQELNGRDVPYFYLDGSTPSAKRLEMCDEFNGGARDIFLISLKAGGTGLNLTGADTVVLYDLWWNPAVEQQAADRAHRIGQKKVVQVIKLVAQGTIEEKMLELQQRKKDLIDEVIQPGEAALSTLSEDDIRELLEI
ncbi:DEAD/DEAH box helicase [Cohnella lupini]|uniref:SNF2 family DNA or RNA helicase n=1 Tax=Cohnella lupini TaxID=1294267 RepID=A0A3D9IQP5_9BACL|nr:DEAD/DEAH box helicase [Cohnella lupini]RED64091.1 SNF2 family DNA or RNA helicase [Cohnella lupini]